MQRFRFFYTRPFLCLGMLALVPLACSTSNNASSPTAAAPASVTCAAAANFQGSGPAPVPTAIDSTCAAIPYTPGALNSNGQQKADVFSWLALSRAVVRTQCGPSRPGRTGLGRALNTGS